MAKLYVVPTPIGNKDDITRRAIEVLKESSLVIAEDTRVIKRLLTLLSVDYSNKKFLSYYEPKELLLLPKVLTEIQEHAVSALVSDTGTPGISDPGYFIIREIRERLSEFVDLEVLPGPSAVITALVSSGFPSDRFTFLGFLPKKSGKLKQILDNMIGMNEIMKTTFITYESPHRIEKTLRLIAEDYNDQFRIALCRELTKKFEQVETGTATELLKMIENKKLNVRGEFVMLFHITENT